MLPERQELPSATAGLVDGAIVACAYSGVTGAGRQATEALSLGEMYGDVRAYKVLPHQHVPEIEMALGRLQSGTRVILTTHLLPVARGIFGTLTIKLAKDSSTTELTELYRARFAGDPTVVIARSAEDVSLRKVVGTNLVMIGVETAGDRAVVTVAIDNLLKGAAGQAIENMNLMLGFPRTAGLTHLARHL